MLAVTSTITNGSMKIYRPQSDQKYANKIIEELELIDLPLPNGAFTWFDGKESVFSLTDRFLVSKDWMEIFKRTKVSRLPRTTSNHFPTMLEAGSFKWAQCYSTICG